MTAREPHRIGRARRKDFGTDAYPYKKQHERRLRLKAAGTCVACGKKPARAGRLQCKACSEKHRDQNARCRALAVEVGICIQCRKRAAREGAKMCAKCSKKTTKAKAERAKANVAAGMCATCSQPRGDNGTSTYCRRCADRRSEYSKTARERLRLAGKCCVCRKDSGGRLKCLDCSRRNYQRNRKKILADAAARYQRRVAARECVICSTPLLATDGLRCSMCAAKAAAYTRSRYYAERQA